MTTLADLPRSVPPIDVPVDFERPPTHVLPEWLARAGSLPVMATALIVVTVLAAGPLSALDDALHEPWAFLHAPSWVPALHVLDRVAGQGVDAPIMFAVAGLLAWRRRTWRPLQVAVGVEVAFYAFVGGLKVVFARPAPLLHEPGFFAGGVISDGWHGISYPSGHAAEAILVYGAVVYLLSRWSDVSVRTLRWLCVGVAWIGVQAVSVSFALGYHWLTDLVGGLLAGAVALHLVILLDRGRDFEPDPAVSDLRACAEGPLRASSIASLN